MALENDKILILSDANAQILRISKLS